jgi:hypothetical protein
MHLQPRLHLPHRPDPGPFGRREPSPFAPLIALFVVAIVIAFFVFLVSTPGY